MDNRKWQKMLGERKDYLKAGLSDNRFENFEDEQDSENLEAVRSVGEVGRMAAKTLIVILIFLSIIIFSLV